MTFNVKQALGVALTFVAMTSAAPTAQPPPPPLPLPLPVVPPPAVVPPPVVPPPVVLPPVVPPPKIVPSPGKRPGVATRYASPQAPPTMERRQTTAAPGAVSLPPLVLPPLPAIPGLLPAKPAAVVPVTAGPPGTNPPAVPALPAPKPATILPGITTGPAIPIPGTKPPGKQ